MPDKVKDSLFSNIIISAGAVLTLLAVLAFVALDAKTIAGEALNSRTELNTKISKLEKLAQLREEAKLAEPRFAILENVLPNRDDLFTFKKEIEAIGKSHGLDVDFSFGSEGEESINYGMSAIGDYDEIIDYIKTIENSIVFMNISSVDVIITEGGYRAAINGSVFSNE